MATKDNEPKAPPKVEQPKAPPRWKDARFAGGVWLAADGSQLTDAEAQQAHRAMDRAAREARDAILRGETP